LDNLFTPLTRPGLNGCEKSMKIFQPFSSGSYVEGGYKKCDFSLCIALSRKWYKIWYNYEPYLVRDLLNGAIINNLEW